MGILGMWLRSRTGSRVPSAEQIARGSNFSGNRSFNSLTSGVRLGFFNASCGSIRRSSVAQPAVQVSQSHGWPNIPSITQGCVSELVSPAEIAVRISILSSR